MVLKRLASRRVCADCGANYSVTTARPRWTGLCDICGGEVVQREDDTEAAIRRRLELYERETAPLIAWYAAMGLLATIDAVGSPDEVTGRLVRVDRRGPDARHGRGRPAGRAPPAGVTVTGCQV